MDLKLGISKMEITPPFPVPLAGFSSRRSVMDGVAKQLYIRVWLFEQPAEDNEEIHNKILLIQADLIWWGSEYIGTLKQRISEQWNIHPEQILLHASHSHGGPQTTNRFSPLLGLMDKKYVQFLENQVLRAIAEANRQVEKVTLEHVEGICRGIGINRRKIVNGKAEFAPNHGGVNDERLTVIRCVTADGKNKGILFHFTCHPTTTDANEVTSEFCGVATEILDGIWGDGVSCFLQGCCADIRPSLYQDDRFYKGDQRDVERLGAILADGVSNLLSAPMTKLEPAPLQGWIQHVTLPFERIPTVADIAEEPGDSEVIAEWKRMMRDHLPETEAALQIQLLQLARGLSLVAMNGEMVVEYGLAIREATEHQALPLGYSNGMIGYVSTARQIDEGGYESVTSGYVFGLPSPFTSDVERRVRQGIHEVVEKIVY